MAAASGAAIARPAASSAAAAATSSTVVVPRATPCGRKSISAEQRYLYFKAFLVWLLFSLGGWSSIPPEYLPIFSHSVGFAFFLVLTTRKTRWLGAIFCGALLFSFLVYQTLPRRWISVIVNASGLTAFLITAVLVMACTVVRQGIHRTTVPEGSAASLMPRRSKRGSSSFASLRNEILGGGSCADSSIAKFCSGKYLEEALESQGYLTLNETTNRVSELHLLGSTALHVDAAVDQASQMMAPVFRRAGDWMDEVGQILARVANEAEFIKFIKLTESTESQGAEKEVVPGEEGVDESDGPARSIHVLSSPEGEEDDDLHTSTPNGDWAMVPSEREEGQPIDAASVPILPSRPLISPPSPTRGTSDNSAALIVAATSSSDDLSSAAFLANASRPHLYAVIRHLNSQLLHVEAASESQRRSELERSNTFSKTISKLKQNLDRESTQKSIILTQLNQMVQRQKEDEAREKRAAALRDGTASAAADPASESEATLKHHLKTLKSKAKSLQNDLWNSNYVLGLSRTRIKVLEDALASAGKTEAALRDANEKQTREHAQAMQRIKEDHARATAKIQRECDAKLRAHEAEVHKQSAIAESALAAAASTAQSASSSSASSGSSGADSSSDESTATPRSNPHALISRLQAQVAELTAQAAQATTEAKRAQQRQSQQLDAASATIATQRSQLSSLEQQIVSLHAALQDAASKLTVEQTIVTSLSNPLASPMHEADELAAIFQRGQRRDRTGVFDSYDSASSADLTPLSTAASSSSHLSSLDAALAPTSHAPPEFRFDHDDLDFLDSEHSTPGHLDHDHDQEPIDARVVAELDQQLLQQHAELHPQRKRDSAITPMRRTALDSSSILSSAPWSLYSSSLSAAPASSLSLSLHAAWSSSAMWSSVAPPLSGAEEQSQLARQLDALESRIKELKQQQQAHGAAPTSAAVIAPPTSVSQAWPSRS